MRETADDTGNRSSKILTEMYGERLDTTSRVACQTISEDSKAAIQKHAEQTNTAAKRLEDDASQMLAIISQQDCQTRVTWREEVFAPKLKAPKKQKPSSKPHEKVAPPKKRPSSSDSVEISRDLIEMRKHFNYRVLEKGSPYLAKPYDLVSSRHRLSSPVRYLCCIRACVVVA